MEALSKFGGEFKRYQFTKYGLKTWTVWLCMAKLSRR
jgi:D-glycero-alpha-D-manno-heptose-7-phosphate kinase